MMVILAVGTVIGTILGFHQFRVLSLVAPSVLVVVGTVASGVASGFDGRTILVGLLGAVASLQIGYLVGIFCSNTCWARSTARESHRASLR